MIDIVSDTIDETGVLDSVKRDGHGAAVLFVGTTRRTTADRETERLVYEAYRTMALAELGRIRIDACQLWPTIDCSIVHRVGDVPIGQTSIAVAVGSPHRGAAFEAAQWIMEAVKTRVPIWKKETWTDGKTEWIHPAIDCRTGSGTEQDGQSDH